MTREQINTIFIDLGMEAPQKGVVNALLNAFNQEKAIEIFNAKEKVFDEAEAKYKDFIKPEVHQKIVDELNAEKDKGALVERKAKYKNANLNIDDEDILSIVESKLKNSTNFDEDLEEYVKAHPSFVKQETPAPKTEVVEPTETITFGNVSSSSSTAKVETINDAVSDYYDQQK